MRPGQNRGTNNYRAKLTEKEVLEIFQASGKSERELAARYGVSQSNINHIRRGLTWTWLTNAHQTGVNNV